MQRFLHLTLVIVILQAIQIEVSGLTGKTNCQSDTETTREIIKLLDPNTLTCPLLADDDEKYCCVRPGSPYATYYCCDAMELYEQAGVAFVLPVLIALLVAMLMVCCVCCMCCPCCFWYKRRNQGAVYNTVVRAPQAAAPPVPQHGPNSSIYQQQQPFTGYMQGYPPQIVYTPHQSVPLLSPNQDQFAPAVPPHGTQYPPAVPPHAQPMPPPYSEVKDSAYSRQAPYNPNF